MVAKFTRMFDGNNSRTAHIEIDLIEGTGNHVAAFGGTYFMDARIRRSTVVLVASIAIMGAIYYLDPVIESFRNTETNRNPNEAASYWRAHVQSKDSLHRGLAGHFYAY